MPRHEKKGNAACHISENAQSAGLGGILKQIFFTRTKSDKIFLQEGKPKVTNITRGNGLLNFF